MYFSLGQVVLEEVFYENVRSIHTNTNKLVITMKSLLFVKKKILYQLQCFLCFLFLFRLFFLNERSHHHLICRLSIESTNKTSEMGRNTTIVQRRNHLNSQFSQDFETSLNDWGTVVLFIRDDTVQSCTTQCIGRWDQRR